MRKLGISIYPEHASLEENKKYMNLKYIDCCPVNKIKLIINEYNKLLLKQYETFIYKY